MSKDQEKQINKNAENVDKNVDKFTKVFMKMTNEERLQTVKEILDHTLSTLEFWHLDTEYPTNLLYCNLEYATKIIKFVLHIISVI